jgi:hypothetical protein
MAEFSVRSDSVDVEQIMQRIRARIREKRGVDYTEDEIKELAAVKLERFLDPKAVRSDLVEHYRRGRSLPAVHPLPPLPAPPPLPPAPGPHPDVYAFEGDTIYESSRGVSGRLILLSRRLLNPILKLFFNPNPLIRVLHMQAAISQYYAREYPVHAAGVLAELARLRQEIAARDTLRTERETERDTMRHDLDALSFEMLNNLVVEMTRVGIESKNLKMRVESLSSRLDFDERRARALEGAVQYRPAPPPPAQPARDQDADRSGPDSQEPAARRRRRRRNRPRRPGGPDRPEGQEGARAEPDGAQSASAPHDSPAEPPASSSPGYDSGDSEP